MSTPRLLFVLFISFINAHDTIASYCWVQKASIGASNRYAAMGFDIGGKGYLAGGWINNVGQTDTWEYDPISDAWTQKASFPGPGRWAGAGFSINGKGYVTVGFTGSSYPTSTFEFDPLTNNWISKAAFPTTGRQDVFSFEINNQGFVFGGYGSNAYINTLYRYDPGNDAWNLQSTLPSSGRDGVAGFVIGNTAYMCGGFTAASGAINQVWAYNAINNSWTAKNPFPGTPRHSASGFEMNGKGFFGNGRNNSYLNDFYEYDSSTDSWSQIPDFPGEPLGYAVNFSLPTEGYIATGRFNSNTTSNQTWLLSEIPTAGFNYSISNCDSLVQFTNTSSVLSTSFWDFGDGSSSTLADPSHYYSSSGSFSVTLVSGNAPCTDTIRQQITISTPIANQILFDVDSCTRTVSFQLFPIASLSATWDFGDGSIGSGMNVNHQYPAAGLYQVSATINQSSGCIDTLITTADLTGISTDGFFVPNVFTPNKDLLNDFFELSGTVCDFRNVIIIDRWGLQVFNSTNPEFKWDGTSNGTLLPQGVYVFLLKTDNKTYSGTISLMR
ncbi:MAG: Kelch repeat-containing protein [Arcticibacter sp.]